MENPDLDKQDYRIGALEEFYKDVKEHMENQDNKISDISENLIYIRAKLYNGMTDAITLLISNQNSLLVEQAKHKVILKGVLWIGGVLIAGLISTAFKVWF